MRENLICNHKDSRKTVLAKRNSRWAEQCSKTKTSKQTKSSKKENVHLNCFYFSVFITYCFTIIYKVNTGKRTVAQRKEHFSLPHFLYHHPCKYSLKSSSLFLTLISNLQPTKQWLSEQIVHSEWIFLNWILTINLCSWPNALNSYIRFAPVDLQWFSFVVQLEMKWS